MESKRYQVGRLKGLKSHVLWIVGNMTKAWARRDIIEQCHRCSSTRNVTECRTHLFTRRSVHNYERVNSNFRSMAYSLLFWLLFFYIHTHIPSAHSIFEYIFFWIRIYLLNVTFSCNKHRLCIFIFLRGTYCTNISLNIYKTAFK
jgi:hypothetical protein